MGRWGNAKFLNHFFNSPSAYWFIQIIIKKILLDNEWAKGIVVIFLVSPSYENSGNSVPLYSILWGDTPCLKGKVRAEIKSKWYHSLSLLTHFLVRLWKKVIFAAPLRLSTRNNWHWKVKSPLLVCCVWMVALNELLDCYTLGCVAIIFIRSCFYVFLLYENLGWGDDD